MKTMCILGRKTVHDTRRTVRIAALLVILATLLNSPLHAARAILSWDPPTHNTDGTVITNQLGYIVAYGTASGVYDTTVDVGAPTELTLTGLIDGQAYYAGVKAYNDLGGEGDFGEEMQWIEPDQTQPTITAPGMVAVSGNGSDQAAIPDLTQNVSVADNMSATANITLTQQPAAGTMFGIGNTSVTVTATDEAGNTAEAVIVVSLRPRPRPPGNLHVRLVK